MPDLELAQPDLSLCNREPIHIPGAIQPHGCLLAVDSEMRVTRAAGDVQKLLGCDGTPINWDVTTLVQVPASELGSTAAQATYVRTVDLVGGMPVDLFVHHSGDELIVEAEPAPAERKTGAEVLGDLLPIVSGIAASTDVIAASQIAADGVRAITGYSRVMIYRFLDDDSGQVIAESRSSGLQPFLNHRYPASDIPSQARSLYLRNPIRVICDADYEPAAIAGGDGPLDLSGALLRSVSPVHVEYLKNMEVGASASISLVQGGALWGLIACHHGEAKAIPHEEREMCRRVGIALDQAISRLEEENTQREALRLTRRREEILPVIAAADSVAAGLRANVDELRRLIAADGIALLLNSEILCSGVTPPEEAVRNIARWVIEGPASDQLVTSELSRLYASAADWSSTASGLLACVVSRTPLTAIFWFRAEETETVNWAGNPHKPVEPGDLPGQLTPRRSFELWAETVRGRSRPWRPNEQEAARRVSASLAEIGRQKALAELNRQLTGAVAEKDLLMREMHHRVQNSLQLVTSMLQPQEKELGAADGEAVRRQLELARDRVLSVALLHRRLWRSDDIELINVETFFSELVEGLIRTWPDKWRSQVTLDVAPVRLPPHEALLIALIVSELLTNAVKHAYAGAAGPVSVTVREVTGDRISITVADKGVGTPDGRPGSFGSRLVQRLVSSLHGELQVAPNNPGTSICLLVPTASSRGS